MIFIDDDTWPPSFHGTGTEDYFNHAWGMQTNAFPMCGTILHESDMPGYQVSYRFHLTDPVHFSKRIKVTLEHGHGNHLSDDWASTAYWYQALPTKPFDIAPVADRIPTRLEIFAQSRQPAGRAEFQRVERRDASGAGCGSRAWRALSASARGRDREEDRNDAAALTGKYRAGAADPAVVPLVVAENLCKPARSRPARLPPAPPPNLPLMMRGRGVSLKRPHILSIAVSFSVPQLGQTASCNSRATAFGRGDPPGRPQIIVHSVVLLCAL